MKWKTIIIITMMIILSEMISAQTLINYDTGYGIVSITTDDSKAPFQSNPITINKDKSIYPSELFYVSDDFTARSITNTCYQKTYNYIFDHDITDELNSQQDYVTIGEVDSITKQILSKHYTLYVDSIDLDGNLQKFDGKIIRQDYDGITLSIPVMYCLPDIKTGMYIEEQDPIQTITTCGNLTKNNTVYVLQNDISYSGTRPCFNFSGNYNTSLNLKGFRVEALTASSVGIMVNSSQLWSIYNGSINSSTSMTAIQILNSSNGTIDHINFTAETNSGAIFLSTLSGGQAPNNLTLSNSNISTGGAVISTSPTLLNMMILNNTIVSRTSNAILFGGQANAVTIAYNSFICPASNCISFSAVHSVNVSYNTITLNASSTTISAIISNLNAVNAYNLFEGNIINAIARNSRIATFGGTGGVANKNSTWRFNTFNLNGTGSTGFVYRNCAANIMIYNNSFINVSNDIFRFNSTEAVCAGQNITNITISNNTISRQPTVNTNASDVKIMGNVTNIYLSNNLNLSASRIIFDVVQLETKRNLTLFNWIQINVTNSATGNGIQNVEININDSFRNAIFTQQLTDANGFTPFIEVKCLELNATQQSIVDCSNNNENTTGYGPFNLSANISGYTPVANKISLNITQQMYPVSMTSNSAINVTCIDNFIRGNSATIGRAASTNCESNYTQWDKTEVGLTSFAITSNALTATYGATGVGAKVEKPLNLSVIQTNLNETKFTINTITGVAINLNIGIFKTNDTNGVICSNLTALGDAVSGFDYSDEFGIFKSQVPTTNISINYTSSNLTFQNVTYCFGDRTCFTRKTSNPCQNISGIQVMNDYASVAATISYQNITYTNGTNVLVTPPASNSCICPYTDVLCSDNCIVSTPCDNQGNSIHLTGSGQFTINARISNYGSDSWNRGSGCEIRCDNNLCTEK